jgi:DNA-directed RNA polymerase specialized sigma24 family protein
MSSENRIKHDGGLPEEERAIREALVRVIQTTTSNVALQDDLLQEALVHMWLIQTRRPGQTRSWYLQSCKFHLQHYLASGRSVDSAKRRAGQMLGAAHSEEEAKFADEGDPEDSVLDWVSARDLVALLSRHLHASERAVLLCLADGLGPRDIGQRLKISHTMVIKHRRRIAALLTRLDHSAVPHSPMARTNGSHHPHANGNGAKSVAKLRLRRPPLAGAGASA